MMSMNSGGIVVVHAVFKFNLDLIFALFKFNLDLIFTS